MNAPVPIAIGWALAEAKATAAQLHSLTDMLNEQLSAVEVAIVQLNLGVSASVPMGDGRLEFRKSGGSWGLFVGTTPLLNANREIRISASAAIPALVSELVDETSRQAVAVRDSVMRVQAVLAAISGKDDGETR
jgi:hypothetical protein